MLINCPSSWLIKCLLFSQNADRAAADIEGHSTTAKFSQPGRLTGNAQVRDGNRPIPSRYYLSVADPVKAEPSVPTIRLLPYVSTRPPLRAAVAPATLLSSNVVSIMAAAVVPLT
jgi:hypothetical protein